MQRIEDALRALRDVQGVYGSFVITTSGELVARELPSAFDKQLFEEVGPRTARLYETFLSGGEEMDACMLRYLEHKLYLRKMSASLIGVLSAVAVNMPALRVVSNLVIRRVDPLVAELVANPLRTGPPPLPVLGTAAPPALAVGGSPPAPSPPQEAVFDARLPDLVLPGGTDRTTVVPQDGRDPTPQPEGRHVRMYRGRRVES